MSVLGVILIQNLLSLDNSVARVMAHKARGRGFESHPRHSFSSAHLCSAQETRFEASISESF